MHGNTSVYMHYRCKKNINTLVYQLWVNNGINIITIPLYINFMKGCEEVQSRVGEVEEK